MMVSQCCILHAYESKLLCFGAMTPSSLPSTSYVVYTIAFFNNLNG